MSTTGDLHKAIVSVWNSNLAQHFQSGGGRAGTKFYDATVDRANFGDWPYCVFEQKNTIVVGRASGADKNSKQTTLRIPVEFRIYAKVRGAVSAKALAMNLASKVKEFYGGHPSKAPQALTLDSGCVLIGQYDGDFGEGIGEDEYLWTVRYNYLLDVVEKVTSITS